MHQSILLIVGLLLSGATLLAQNPPALAEGGTVQHEVRYVPRDGSEIYLTWKPVNRSPADVLELNPGARMVDSLLYVPMATDGGAYRATMSMPEATEYYYCFWITKSANGHYQDFWDLEAGGIRSTADATTFQVTGQAESKPAAHGGGWHPAWLLALSLIIGYWMLSRGRRPGPGPPTFRLVLSTGVALAAVHVVARAQILEIGLTTAYHYPLDSLKQLMAASAADLAFVGGLTALALLASGLVSRIFTWVAVLATFVCVINVSAVNYLGHPFTYQWLYYSGFIIGPDAIDLVNANLTAATVADLLAYPLILILGAGCLTITCRYLPAWVLPLLLITLVTGSAYTATRFGGDLQPGLTGNGVTTFLASAWSADTPDSFLSRSLSPEQRRFSDGVIASRAFAVPDSLTGRVRNLVFIVLESAGGVYFDRFPGAKDPAAPLASRLDRSMRFDNVYAHSPSTNSSMVSLLNGIYPPLSYRSVTQESPELNFPSLASVLSERGYRTSFFSSADQSWLNTREYLEARDFDLVEDYRSIECDQQFRLDKSDYQQSSGVDDNCLADRFATWRDQDPDRPFFSMLWTVQGHYPYYYAGEEVDYGVESFIYNRYLNAVRHGTEMVAGVLDDLRRTGLDSTTLVVVTGDHGEAFGQHGHHGHGNTLHEEDLRVPLYFINPLLFHGERHDGLGSAKDLAPTILRLLGVDPPAVWQGHDLLATRSEEGFYFAPWTNLYFGYRRGNKKYIFNETTAGVEVFDLAEDPQERHDLSAQTPASEIDAARIRLSAWVQRQDEFYKAIH